MGSLNPRSVLLPPFPVRQTLKKEVGLGFIPALPFIFDEPVEHVVDKAFDFLEDKLYKDQPEVRRAMKSEESHES